MLNNGIPADFSSAAVSDLSAEGGRQGPGDAGQVSSADQEGRLAVAPTFSSSALPASIHC